MSAQTHAMAPDHSQDHGHDHGDEPHILPLKLYLGVWAVLMVLTATTVFVAQFDFGTWNTVVALVVATIKGTLVAAYFMHLRYDNKFNVVVMLAGLLFVAIFFTPILTDITTRGTVDPLRNQGPPANGFVQVPPPPPGAAHGAAHHGGHE